VTPDDVLTRAAPPPDLVISYGEDPECVADVRLPSHGTQPGKAPLVLFLHGGFWRVAYDRSHTGPLATALAEAGYAVCVPEFRRTGEPGGGWPETFDHVAAAVDTLPDLVRRQAGEDVAGTGPVLLAGHSAGGHLALWAAARHLLDPGSGWPVTSSGGRAAGSGSPVAGSWGRAAGSGDPGGAPREVPGGGRQGAGSRWGEAATRPLGVVALAAVSDLRACHELALGGGAVDALLGGRPDEYPERYRLTDPAQLLPLRCPVRLVHGSADDRVPCAMSHSYASRARAYGDDARVDELAGAGHFDVIDPLSAVWPRVLAAFQALAPTG
jgi:acetyl esterase/lipase